MVKNLLLEHDIKKGVRKHKLFAKPVKYIYDRTVGADKSLGEIPIADQTVIKDVMAYCMGIGSQLTKRKYIFSGIAVGVMGSYAVYEFMKRRRKVRRAL